jgi:predicted NUDIX family phosphoesterase
VRHGDRILTHRHTRRQPEKRLAGVKAAALRGHMTVSDLIKTRQTFMLKYDDEANMTAHA